MWRVILGAMAIAVAAAGCAGTAGPEPEVRLELRAAESARARGLTEMVVKGSDTRVWVSPDVILTNADVASATVRTGEDGAVRVELVLTEGGRRAFSRATMASIGKPVAILIDGEVVSAPIVRDRIDGGQAVVTGAFTREEAERIARGLFPAGDPAR